jgi:hypothetical protein
MYLTSIEFAGAAWSVVLTVEPSEAGPGLLRFRYTSAERPEGVSWLASDATLGRLAEDGVEISESLLRDQLELALMLEQASQPATDAPAGEEHGRDGLAS